MKTVTFKLPAHQEAKLQAVAAAIGAKSHHLAAKQLVQMGLLSVGEKGIVPSQEHTLTEAFPSELLSLQADIHTIASGIDCLHTYMQADTVFTAMLWQLLFRNILDLTPEEATLQVETIYQSAFGEEGVTDM